MLGGLAERLLPGCVALDNDFSDLEQEFLSQLAPSNQDLWSGDVFSASGCASQQRTCPPSDDDMLDDAPYISTNRVVSSDGMDIALEEDIRTSVRPKRRSNEEQTTRKDGAFDQLDLQTLMKLIDTALRTLICNNPTRTAAGIKTSADPSGPKLADISPALFSPGYLSVRVTFSRGSTVDIG